MPEHTYDPIRDLENFDSGGLAMTPLEPAQVRRLGDRRRTRRNAGVVAAAVVAVLVAASPVALLAGKGGDDRAPAPAGSASPSPSPSPTTTAPAEITYPGRGVEVVTESDAGKLTGTTAAFRAFIVDQARKAADDGASCPGAAHGVTVQKYSSAGYAIGAFNACGGYAALWTRYHDTWGEGQATQDVWDCDALTFLKVPRSFAGDCADEAGSFGLRGSGAPEPGMTRAQAEAAGLQVTSDAAAPPCVSTQYAAPVVPGDDTRGLFSPHDGLVQVLMTSAMKTAEKVGLGTPRSAVRAAYPDGQSAGENLWLVPRPGGTAFVIRFATDGTVMRFSWQLDTADCADYMR